jgi:hypothetical protein
MTKVMGNEVVTLIAKCTDNDGGCRDVQIRVETTTWVTNSDGSVSQIGPNLAGAPEVSNPDTAKNPGDTASKERTGSYNMSIGQIRGASTSAVRLRPQAKVINFFGGSVDTAMMTLEWP